MQLVNYFFGMVVAPAQTGSKMLREREQIRLGLLYTIGFAFLYSLTALILYWGAHLPLAPALPIPPQQWYLYQALYTIPVAMIAIGLFVAVSHGSARWLGGTGHWRNSFMLLGLGSILPWFFFTWLPETLFALLQQPFPWDQNTEIIRQVIPGVWQWLLCSRLLQLAHKLAFWKCVLCVLLGIVPMALIFALFIR